MFDTSLPSPAEMPGLDDAVLAGVVTGWARASAAADANKLAAIAEVERRRCADSEHANWVCDAVDAAAGEVSCALTISHGRALGQIGLATALRDRLPKLRARFLAGDVSPAMVSTIVSRTCLVLDEVALARIDSEIAERASAWGPLSQYKLEQSIDFWVDRYDPDAVRRLRNSVRGRDFVVGHRDDATGTTSVYGRLSIADGVLLEQRIAAMIGSVCEDDPRTLGQRRADSVGAITAGASHLACLCDNPTCAAKVHDGPASNVVIHVIAEKESLDEAQDPKLHGGGVDRPPAPTEPARPEADPPPPPRRKAALIPGAKGAMLPAVLLAELIAHGAKVRVIGAPDDKPEDRYRPSTRLQEFIRSRDLTCRFPGCDRPAAYADIDHTQPWPVGATHPGNLKCFCRLHHLMKTFWHGWTDRQCPDATVVITTPSGLSYTTKPLSSLLFPQWKTNTSPPPPTEQPAATAPGRQLMMPTRRRTREQSRLSRITTERRLNAVERALDAGLTPEPVAVEFDYGDDPPPF